MTPTNRAARRAALSRRKAVATPFARIGKAGVILGFCAYLHPTKGRRWARLSPRHLTLAAAGKLA